MTKPIIFIATPMYGGVCTGQFTQSCIDLQKFCDEKQILIYFGYLYNESLVHSL
jgi:hypothetical protein